MVVLVFLIGGMGIAITKDPPILTMFYAMLAGAVVIIMYSAMQGRKRAQRENRRKKYRK